MKTAVVTLLTVFPPGDGVTSMALRFAAALYSDKATDEFTFLGFSSSS